MPKRVRQEVERRLIGLANEHRDWTAGELAYAISREGEFGDNAASERWIRSRLPRWRDKSTWTLAVDTTGRPDVVLHTLAVLHRLSQGRINRIGQNDAKWVVRLTEGLPRLASSRRLPITPMNPHGSPAFELYVLAQIFRVADDANDGAELARLTAEVAVEYGERED